MTLGQSRDCCLLTSRQGAAFALDLFYLEESGTAKEKERERHQRVLKTTKQ